MPRARSNLFTPGELAALRRAYPLPDMLARDGVRLQRKGDEWQGLCPFHSERTPSFYVFAEGERYHCFGCGASGDVFRYVMETRRLSFRDAVRSLDGGRVEAVSEDERLRRNEEREEREASRRRFRVEAARRLWAEARPIAGTPAETYLRARGIRIELPPTLRFHPEVKLKGEGLERDRMLPALVAGVQDVRGRVQAVHRIYLGPESAESGKAAAKKLLGVAEGGAVRLAPKAEEMAVCEGIETGLAIRQAVPELALWAGIDATHMAAVVWPEGVWRLTIAADRDPPSEKPGPMQGKRPGELWARIAAERFVASRPGREAFIAVPPGERCDFNDLLRGAGEAAA